MDPEQIPLRDLHLPADVGWWPLAPGWWVLIGLAGLGLLWFAVRLWRAWHANRARRVALRQLGHLSQRYREAGDLSELAKSLSELLRRVVLAYAPRGEVASLTGAAWLAWLDQGLDEKVFADGAGRAIESLPYRRPGDDAGVDADALIAAVEKRLRTPLIGGLV